MRARELRSFLSYSYGDTLPDDDAGRDDLALLLGYVMQLNRPRPPGHDRRGASVGTVA